MNRVLPLAVALMSLNCVAQNRRELRQDARERRDDRHDQIQLEMLLSRFDAARAHNDVAALSALDIELDRALQEELRESHGELRKDVAEIHRDRREIREERREVRRDAYAGNPGAFADDKRDLRDDRRDLRDDVRDAKMEMGAFQRKRALAAELRTFFGRQDPPSLDRKRALIVELTLLARAERAQNGEERREDKRELREDRREMREDRRR